MRSVNLIVSCANRKKADVPEELRARSLTERSLHGRIDQWTERLATHDVPSAPAADLYAGDHWQVAQSIPRVASGADLRIRLWVCSAGYGLLDPSDPLKPYSATFATGQPDSVCPAADTEADGAFTSDWWSGLCAWPGPKKAPRTVTALVEREPSVPLVVVASMPYLVAMAPDLRNAVGASVSADQLSILSVGANETRLPQLKAHLLPGDARFEAVVGGARAALNARVARLLFRGLPRDTSLSTSGLSATLAELAADLPPLRRSSGRPLSDDQVLSFIDRNRHANPSISKTRLRASGSACEQTRFSEIFHQALEASTDAS